MPTPDRNLKLALLTNMVAPSRIPVYRGLGSSFDLLLLHGGSEANRDSWRDLDTSLPNASVKRAWGWQIRMAKKENGETIDHRYLHLTPGYIWHLLRFRPDVVVTNEMGLRTLISLTYGALFGKPVWVWWGGTLHTERKLGPARRALRTVVSLWARRWISYGQSSSEYLVSLGVDSNRILQIQNAVDEQRFAAPTKPGFDLHPRPVLLHVGQFIARKGIELLLQAAAALQKEGKEFSLLLVGSGPDKQALERLAAHLNIKHAHFESSRPPEEMPSVYRSADVLIFPTLEDVWGLVANEAMLSGLSVLCSKYAGCANELFRPDNIFNPKDPAEFAVKLGKAISGELPKSDLSCLKSTSQIVGDLVRALESSARRTADRLTDAPRDPLYR
jgi:glycosyltransferase involved in cell wall biosynthesis